MKASFVSFKYYTFISVLILFLLFNLFSCLNSSIITPESAFPASNTEAGNIDEESGLEKNLSEEEKFIELLLSANIDEREKIIKENKEKITSDFINKVLLEANEYCNNIEDLSRGTDLVNLALELSDFMGDKISKGKALLFYSILEYVEKQDKSLPSLEEARSLFIEAEDLKGEGACYLVRGAFQVNWGNYKEGMANIEHAMAIYEKIGAERELADAVTKIADVYSKHGEREKALEYYERALKIYKKNNSAVKEAILHQFIAGVMIKFGFFKEALQNLTEMQSILENITEKEIEEEKGNRIPYYNNRDELDKNYDRELLLIRSYGDLGILYNLWGKYEEALKTYQKELELIDMYGKGRKEEIQALWKLGNIYKKLGKKEKTLEYFKKSLEIESDEMDKSYKVVNYYALGFYYLYDLDDPEGAIECFDKGMAKADEIDLDILRTVFKYLGLRVKGEAYLEKGEPELAKKYLEEALAGFQSVGKNYGSQEDNIIQIYMSLGRLYEKKENPDEAKRNYEKALDLSRTYFFPGYEADIYELLGDLYEKEKDYEKTLEYYNKSLEIYRSLNLSDQIWRGFFLSGKVYEKQGKMKEAYEYYKSAIDIIENMRQNIKVEDFKRDFMKNKIEVYEAMIELLIKEKKEDDAFNYSERARNRAFLDTLSNQKVDFHHGAPQELIDREEELIRKIQILNSSLSEAGQKPESGETGEQIEKFTSDLKELKLEYEELIEQLKLESPEYASLVSIFPEKFEDIQNLLDKETLLLEYFIAKDKVFLWAVSRDKINTFILDIDRENLNEKVRLYREEISLNMTLEKIKSVAWKEKSKELYFLLLEKAEGVLKNKEQIVIVPHMALNYLPFQTLMDSEGNLLLEKFDITYLPSASVLKYCREKNKPSYENLVAYELGNYEVSGYSPLPYSKKEVENISRFYKKRDIYSEKDMTVESVYISAPGGDVIHFATHSILDSESPMFSSLIMSDGPLEVFRVFDMDLSAGLVTLSACSTGLGEITEGDELVGLSRAFIYAGTPTVCVSLWDVSDMSTAELMERFYYYLNKGKTKSESLRLAEIEMKEKYNHPFFWAPFIVIGDWK